MELPNFGSNKNDMSLFKEMERLNKKEFNFQGRIGENSYGENSNINSPSFINHGYYPPSIPRAPPSYYFQNNTNFNEENAMRPYNELSNALAAQYIIASDPFFQSAQTYLTNPFPEVRFKNTKRNKYG